MAWLAALVTQTAFERITGKNKAALRTIAVFCGMLVSVALCYVTGTLWYSLQSGTSVMQAAAVTAVPFIPWDILKCAAASAYRRNRKSDDTSGRRILIIEIADKI